MQQRGEVNGPSNCSQLICKTFRKVWDDLKFFSLNWPYQLVEASGAALFFLGTEGLSLYPACLLLPALVQMSPAPAVDVSCPRQSTGPQLVRTQTALWRRRATSTPCQKLRVIRTSSALRYGCCCSCVPHAGPWAHLGHDQNWLLQ